MVRAAAFLSLLAMAVPSLANAITIPSLPAGMCALEPKVPEHAVVIDYLTASNKGSNEVLATFARCDELDAIAAKKATGIHHYGVVLKQALGQAIPLERKAYVETAAMVYSATGAALTQTALTGAREAVAVGTKGSGLNNPKAMTADTKGVLFRDDSMLIIGMQQTNGYGGKNVAVASIAAMTIIGGQPVSENLYTPASNADAFATSAENLKPFVAKLIATNP
jgi:hypothetical protein